jgi:hypothetical protein
MNDDIEGLVRRHDQYQFEVKLEYDLRRENKLDRYKVETFFFIPTNLDVNGLTYKKSRFYKDRLLYIRFASPDFTLGSLNDPANERSPLRKIPAKVERFLGSRDKAAAESAEYEIKLLGCVYKSGLRDLVRFVEGRLKRTADASAATDVAPRLDEFLAETERTLAAYRSLREKLLRPGVPRDLAAAYSFVDEYMSLLTEGWTHTLLQSLDAAGRNGEWGEFPRRAAALIERETSHRRKMGYPSVVDPSGDNEVFVFRLGVLKKFVTSVLHLNVQTRQEGKGLQEAGLALGAGVAMAFATAVAFYYQRTYGALSISFAVALVFSYMMKDRLKALSQDYMRKIIARNLPDQSTAIFDAFNRDRLGVCRELVRFAEERELEPLVLRLRDRDHITEIENDWRREEVLYYLREIELKSAHLAANQSRKTAVTDILRFNVEPLLSRMDDPQADVHYLRDGKSETLRATRVYHVNVVIKFSSDKDTHYERIRLVLTRRGIKRIETVSSEVVPA